MTDANSVVVKSNRGLEILDLKSGEPMAILPLSSSSRDVVWADVDDDDIIDQVSVEFMAQSENERGASNSNDWDALDDEIESNCFLTAKSTFATESSSSFSPSHSSQMRFNVSICHIPLFQRLHFDFFHDGSSHHPAVSSTLFSSSIPPPLILPSVAHRAGLLHHLSGYSIHRGVHGKDVIAALPDGRLVKLSSKFAP